MDDQKIRKIIELALPGNCIMWDYSSWSKEEGQIIEIIFWAGYLFRAKHIRWQADMSHLDELVAMKLSTLLERG